MRTDPAMAALIMKACDSSTSRIVTLLRRATSLMEDQLAGYGFGYLQGDGRTDTVDLTEMAKQNGHLISNTATATFIHVNHGSHQSLLLG